MAADYNPGMCFLTLPVIFDLQERICRMGFQIGDILIPYYGLCMAIGVILAGAVGLWLVHVFHRDVDDFIILAACVGLGGLAGAKILYFIVSWGEIDVSRLTDMKYLAYVMGSGFVFYGGLLGGLVSIAVCQKAFHIDVLDFASFAVPCIPIVHGIGRIGCSLAGCCYGIPYSGFGAVTYTDSLAAPNGISLFPVQKTEAVCNLLIAAVLLIYIYRNRTKTRNSLLLYLMLYAPVRFVLEYFRYDEERGFLLGVSISQWISIFLFVGALFCYIVRKRKKSIKSL